MATDQSDNHQRLRDVGMITSDDLPPEHASVVESLSSDEVDVLVAVKKRLDEAERTSGSAIGDNFIAP